MLILFSFSFFIFSHLHKYNPMLSIRQNKHLELSCLKPRKVTMHISSINVNPVINIIKDYNLLSKHIMPLY